MCSKGKVGCQSIVWVLLGVKTDNACLLLVEQLISFAN